MRNYMQINCFTPNRLMWAVIMIAKNVDLAKVSIQNKEFYIFFFLVPSVCSEMQGLLFILSYSIINWKVNETRLACSAFSDNSGGESLKTGTCGFLFPFLFFKCLGF